MLMLSYMHFRRLSQGLSNHCNEDAVSPTYTEFPTVPFVDFFVTVLPRRQGNENSVAASSILKE
jgi:hypothetical protein